MSGRPRPPSSFDFRQLTPDTFAQLMAQLVDPKVTPERRRVLNAQLVAAMPWLRLCPQVPHGKQLGFLMLWHRDVFFGGAAGPGKSSALIMASLQYVHVPGYNALLIRRTFRQLNQAESLMNRAKQWLLGKPGVEWHGGDKRFSFQTTGQPAALTFGYCDTDDDVYQYDSAEFQFVGIDESTALNKWQRNYLHSRMRKPNCAACDALLIEAFGPAFCAAAHAKGFKVLMPHALELLRHYRIVLATAPAKGTKDLPTPSHAAARDAFDTLRNSLGITPQFWRGLWDEVRTAMPTRVMRSAMTAPIGTEHIELAHVPLRMRSGSNPGNRGHEEVKTEYINDGTGGDPCRAARKDCPECGRDWPSDQALCLREGTEHRPACGLVWATKDRLCPNCGEEAKIAQQYCPDDGQPLVDGKFFVVALYTDNPSINAAEYASELRRIDALRAEQLLKGDWDARAAGEAFDRLDFELVEDYPRKAVFARGWDWGGTKGDENSNADYTAGGLMCMDREGTFYIIDIVRRREDSLGVDRLVEHTAKTDKAAAPGCTHVIPQDPGAAGLAYCEHLVRGPLRGHSFEIEPMTSDRSKWVRAKPFSSSSKAHNVKVVMGPWNKDFFAEAEQFGPDPDKYDHEDMIDGLASAFNWLAGHRGEIAFTSGKEPEKRRDPHGHDEDEAVRRYFGGLGTLNKSSSRWPKGTW